MGLLDLLVGKRELLPEEMPPPRVQEQALGDAELLPVLYEETPGALDLGWYASNDANEIRMAKIAEHDRATHLYVIGATGTGKTRFLEFLIQQDLVSGRGFGVIDPHGDLVEDVKGFIAAGLRHGERELLDRVVLVDPTDPDYTAIFNPLERLPGVSAAEQAQELISAFRKIWSSAWGVRMEDLLRHSLIALGEADRTLTDLPTFLTSGAVRQEVLARVEHEGAIEYFRRFDALTERARLTWVEPVLNKVNALLADERVRALFSSPQSTFQLRDIMDSGKILLIKLDKGRLQDAADLLGSLLLAKIKMAAFSRSDVPQAKRRPWALFIDEFQNYAADSFSVVLSEARKYGLSLVMAHQTLAQVPAELRSVILGNAGIQVYFRLGRHDAQLLAKEAFEYSGFQVKRGGRSPRYWSLGEEWERYTQELQTLPPRACYVKHKIQGGLLLLGTVEIEDPADALGMRETEYRRHLASLGIGRPYVVERKVLPGPATATNEASSSKPLLSARPAESTSPLPVTAEPPAAVEAAESSGAPPLDHELLRYLQEIAAHPFSAALQRDERLGLSRYKGAQLRQRLSDSDLVRVHRVSTGRRSGQLALLELTSEGEELLRSMKVRLRRPRGRGSFLHRYYQHKLGEYAEATWPHASVEIERRAPASNRYADVTVHVPVDGTADPRTIAFEVFMTGEAKEIDGLARDLELFDRVYLCAETLEALASLKAKAEDAIKPGTLERATFNLIGPFLAVTTPEQKKGKAPSAAGTRRKRTSRTEGSVSDAPTQSRSLKRVPESETEPESAPSKVPGRRGRKPKTPFLRQVEQAFEHLHDLDWLQESPLTELEAVREGVNALHPMPEAQALRALLVEAAKRAAGHAGEVPASAPLKIFLERHLEGKSVVEIAEELGVSREWCSRSYRKRALQLAGMQFVQLVSVE